MARQTINIGTNPNDGTGDPLRNAYDKCNDNFLELYEQGGANITVNNPVTSTETTLDDALADLVGGGGGGAVDSVNGQTGVVSVDLQSVTDALLDVDGFAETTDGIKASKLKVDQFEIDNISFSLKSQFDPLIDTIVGSTDGVLSVVDGFGGNFGVSIVSSGVGIINNDTNRYSNFDNQGLTHSDIDSGKNLLIKFPDSVVGTNKTINFKDESGTVAYLSDIPSSSAYKFVQTSQTPHTGTILETLMATATINGGTFSTSDVMKVLFGVNKTGTLGTYSLRLRVNTLNTLVGATQVALFTSAGTSAQMSIMSRSFSLNGGNLYGYSFSGNALTDIASIGGALSSTAYNTANTLYFFWTVQLANAGDSITPNLTLLTN